MPTTLTPETTPFGDTVQRERFDWGDRQDETHCVHGSYVGYPLGPDYLCGPCEDSAYTRFTGAVQYELACTIVHDGRTVVDDWPVGYGASWVSYTDPDDAWKRIARYADHTSPFDSPDTEITFRVITRPYSFWDTDDHEDPYGR